MHELGIVFTIADRVKQIAQENHAAHVESVTVEIGEVSDVIHAWLTDCWDWNATRTPLLKGCRLDVIKVPAITHCDGCDQLYHTIAHGKICPYCGSDKTWLLQGNETTIRDIRVSDPPEPQPPDPCDT